MVKIGAFLAMAGCFCRLVDPKSFWANGTWICCMITATLGVLNDIDRGKVLQIITLLSALITVFFLLCGFISLKKRVQQWM